MNSPDESWTEDALDGEAAAWLYEREEGFAPERAEAFAAWCDCDPRHAAAVARVEGALSLLAELPAVRAPLEARFGRVADEMPRRARVAQILCFSGRGWCTGIAAAVIIGLAAWWMVPAHAPGEEHYAAAAGGQRRVALQDGSTVDVNVGGEMRVHFTTAERHVTLDTGEAHFDVAPDASRPFVVTAGGVSVRAVGTAFNVRLDNGSVDVLVVEGKVLVSREVSAGPAASALRPQLVAGERLRIAPEDVIAPPRIEKVDPSAIRAMLAWQDTMMTFNDVPLREILERFNHRNVTQLMLADPDLGKRRIGGVIALDQVEAFVRLLETDGDIVAERIEDGKIVLRRGR